MSLNRVGATRVALEDKTNVRASNELVEAYRVLIDICEREGWDYDLRFEKRMK